MSEPETTRANVESYMRDASLLDMVLILDRMAEELHGRSIPGEQQLHDCANALEAYRHSFGDPTPARPIFSTSCEDVEPDSLEAPRRKN